MENADVPGDEAEKAAAVCRSLRGYFGGGNFRRAGSGRRRWVSLRLSLIHILRLLSEKYRRATILYYLENKSCAEIAGILSVSESMVKYLLFKSRKLLKEGMSMERNYGEQSYQPKRLELLFWGNGPNRYYSLCSKLIPQNILFACYNDSITAEQIALEIGVGLPYFCLLYTSRCV